MPEGTQSALTKISRAIDRGTLSRVSVQSGGTILAVVADEPARRATRRSQWRTQPSNPAMLAWFERSFPGGYHRLARRDGLMITRANRDPGVDRWEYITEADGRSCGLVVRYSLAHVHHEVRAHAFLEDVGGSLHWLCVSCNTQLSATEAALLGLPTRTRAASG